MEGNKFFEIFGLTLLCVSICCAQEVTVQIDQNNVQPGGNIKLTCTVEGFENGNLIRWKRLYEKDGGEAEDIVAENNLLSANFDPSKGGVDRYKVGIVPVEGKDNAYDVQLDITGAKLEDSGLFSCSYLDKMEKILVSVVAEPNSISLMMDGVEQDMGAEIEMEAGETHSFTCTVGGSNPAPDVDIQVQKKLEDDKPMSISAEFTTDTQVTYVSVDDNVKSLQLPSYTKTLSADPLTIQAKYGNKFLKCVGSVQGGLNVQMKYIYIRFKGTPPEFTCPGELVSYVGQTDVSISCEVSANPALVEHSITFYEGSSKNASVVLKQNDEEFGHYTYKFEKVQYVQKYMMYLHISRVFPQMFREYYFEATNDYGSVEHEIVLVRDPSMETVDGSSVLGFSLLVMTFTLLAHLL